MKKIIYVFCVILIIFIIGFLANKKSTTLWYQKYKEEQYNKFSSHYTFHFGNSHYLFIILPKTWSMESSSFDNDINTSTKTFSGKEGEITITYFRQTEFGGACPDGIDEKIDFKSLAKIACAEFNQNLNKKFYRSIYVENGDTSGYSIDATINNPTKTNEKFIKNILKTLELQ